MSKLLFDKHPLVINPELAKAVGLNEAIILQQIHYWTSLNSKENRNFKDGHYWTYNSYTSWRAQFPFWGRNTFDQVFSGLSLMVKDSMI